MRLMSLEFHVACLLVLCTPFVLVGLLRIWRAYLDWRALRDLRSINERLRIAFKRLDEAIEKGRKQ